MRHAGLFILAVFAALHAQKLPFEPVLPTAFLDTHYVAASGNTIAVNSGDSLQAAIDSARPGDEIVVQAGATFVGNFVLRANGGPGWITIRSSRLGDLPEGVRVSSSQTALMASIQTANSNAAFSTEESTSYYRLAGLEITVAAGTRLNYGLVSLGTGAESVSHLPSNLIVDRSYVHGISTCDCKRGVAINGVRESVIDSYISEIHVRGQDTQAIAGWNGPGPFKIVNNYLEAAGENFMLGGADPTTQNLIPSDVEFRRNYVFKPLSWKASDPSYAGTHWTVKNLFELKNAQRILIDGNVFENCWTDGQTGVGVVFKSANQSGNCQWCVTQDVIFSNNIIKNVEGGFLMNGHESYSAPAKQPPNASRIKITNVLVYPTSRLLLIENNVQDVQITHMTGFGSYYLLMSDGSSTGNSPFLFRDSIVERRPYGVGSGSHEGTWYLDAYFSPWAWDHVMLINTSVGTAQDTSSSQLLSRYPSGTTVIDGYARVGFLNLAGAEAEYHGYALSRASVGYAAASDGRDLGVDFSALDAAMQSPTYMPPDSSGASSTLTLVTSPTSATLYGGQAQQFSVSAVNLAGTAVSTPSVTWSVSPSVGTISSSGFYTAPEWIALQQTITVTVTSQADATKSASATVTLVPSRIPDGACDTEDRLRCRDPL